MSSPNEVFGGIANFYDVLYQDKNYEAECDYLEKVFCDYGVKRIHTVLDLGCGTGGHAIPLVGRGYRVMGIDRSERMIRIAQQKALSSGVADRAQFQCGDIQKFDLGKTFEAIISMFAVIGYQTSNQKFFSTLQTIRKHLVSGGLFVWDFWYGPAVLKKRPTERAKVISENGDRLFRLARPLLDTQSNVVTIHYDLFHFHNSQMVDEAQENHAMRFFFKPEIEFFLGQAGFELMAICPFAELNQAVSEETWNVSAIARAL